MKRVLSMSLLGLGIVLCMGAASQQALGACVPEPTDSGVRIYYHNSGLCTGCIQDNDMDFPELRDFLTSFAPYIGTSFGLPVIGDTFLGCAFPDEPHGNIVKSFYEWACGCVVNDLVESTAFGGTDSWAQMIQSIADNPIYGEGSVVNLSNGTLIWSRNNTQAVTAAYASEVLLVGAPLTFASAPESLGDKVLRCWPMTHDGQFTAGVIPNPPNIVAVGVPTNWFNGADLLVAKPADGAGWPGLVPAWTEHGSFSTPLLAGTVKLVADAVGSREPAEDYTIARVLDYVISACDRNVDADSYAHRLGETLPSFGPWSPIWGYGVFSPWKALLYAYGFGRIEAKDSSLDAVSDPPTIFSDHYELRGDLFVAAGETLRISPLASVTIVTSTPEGPTDLGVYPALHEIRVAGTLEVESSLNGGVSCTVVVDAGGSASIRDGGEVTIGAGQVLNVASQGALNLETGGQLAVQAGGTLLVQGSFDLAGALTVESGASVVFAPGSAVALAADLVTPAGSTFIASSGAVVTVASADALGSGADPDRVEIDCRGVALLSGSSNAPLILRGEIAGAGAWSGLTFDSADAATSTVSYVEISDAAVGLRIAGTAPVNPWNLTIDACGTGVEVVGRNGVALVGGEISNCSEGLKLDHASIDVTDVSLHDHGAGIACTASSPRVRSCLIYANTNGVVTFDSGSLPDLGTSQDPGNNDFKGPGPLNTLHISAFDPASDIYAQENWWGTKKGKAIASRIMVIDAPPAGAGSVIYQPFLTAPPTGLPGVPVPEVEPRRPTLVAEGSRFGFAGTRVGVPGRGTEIAFHLGVAGPARLEVYDLRGRLVQVLLDGFLQAGPHRVRWEGRDRLGRTVAAGVYFARLRSPEGEATQKLVLAR